MKRILITNVDSYFGYNLAFQFLQLKRQDTEFVLLCHERQLTSKLTELGGKVHELSTYKDKERLAEVCRGVSYVILVPENSLQSYEEGCCIIQCAKQHNVNYMAMLSFVGIDKLNKKTEYLDQLHQLETNIRANFDKDSFCIFRSTLWHQFFWYFGPMIENQNKIELNLHEKVKWGTIDLSDLVQAIIQLSIDTGDCKENQTVFEFTPSLVMNTKEMVQAASQGLDLKDMTYNQVDPSVLCKYLSKIHDDNRFKSRPNHMFPLGQYLNQHLIQLIIEYLELLNQLTRIDTTKDLEHAIKRQPHSIQDFFKQNKHQFKQLK